MDTEHIEEIEDIDDFAVSDNSNTSFITEPQRHVAISHYREMFTVFCNTVQTPTAEKICSIPLFRERYADTTPKTTFLN